MIERIQSALCGISSLLRAEGIPHMLIGALAVMIWGRARLTEDIDVTVWLPESGIDRLLSGLTEAGFTIVPAEPVEFIRDTKVLPVLAPVGIRIDLVFGMLPYERKAIERAVPTRFGPAEAPVCTAEDLIVLKAVSTRPKDRADIEGIVGRMGTRLDRSYLLPILEELSILLDRPDLREILPPV